MPMEVPIVVPVPIPVSVPGVLPMVAPMLLLLLSLWWLYALEVLAMHPMLVVASLFPIPHLLHHPHLPKPTLLVEVPLALQV